MSIEHNQRLVSDFSHYNDKPRVLSFFAILSDRLAPLLKGVPNWLPFYHSFLRLDIFSRQGRVIHLGLCLHVPLEASAVLSVSPPLEAHYLFSLRE